MVGDTAIKSEYIDNMYLIQLSVEVCLCRGSALLIDQPCMTRQIYK